MALIRKGFKLSKDGRKLNKTVRHLDTSAKIRQRTSKRVRVARKGQIK